MFSAELIKETEDNTRQALLESNSAFEFKSALDSMAEEAKNLPKMLADSINKRKPLAIQIDGDGRNINREPRSV